MTPDEVAALPSFQEAIEEHQPRLSSMDDRWCNRCGQPQAVHGTIVSKETLWSGREEIAYRFFCNDGVNTIGFSDTVPEEEE